MKTSSAYVASPSMCIPPSRLGASPAPGAGVGRTDDLQGCGEKHLKPVISMAATTASDRRPARGRMTPRSLFAWPTRTIGGLPAGWLPNT
ncbi:hypothetical protein [Hymenobacter volaticus]|uniref:Uncharacterized protein n=1 Tax=Hymenobacter volaticus TaxID=2932254 RepID=A0ABY4GFD6_9BACT|nr:hypothetical protein [Hymenobacter volaticus]UOQ69054.1 hypothetical protein MUN86_26490 [Hymenobacter volaticus]